MEGRDRRTGTAGFTLVEVLVAVVVMSLVAIAVAAISLPGVLRTKDESVDRHLDATAAQFVSVRFTRDAKESGVVDTAATCSPATGVTPLVGLASADYYARQVDGGSTPTNAGDDEFELWRGCPESGELLVDGLGAVGDPPATGDPVVPTAVCHQGTTASVCAGSPTPQDVRLVTLRLQRGGTSSTRDEQFEFEVDGALRTGSGGSSSTTTPTSIPGTTVPPEFSDPEDAAALFALGGTSPLVIQGNGTLTVRGRALINSSSSAAVDINGANGRLVVVGENGYPGDFRILQGGQCKDCTAVNTQPFPPGSFSTPLPDPLAGLVPPLEAGRPNGVCSAGTCTPGIYTYRPNLTGDVTFEPGVYIFRQGLKIAGSGQVDASEVLFFNGCTPDAQGCSSGGVFEIGGQAQVEMSPMKSGPFAGILLFQARGNTASVSISGGSKAMLLDGIFYAPDSTSVDLGAGGGGLDVGMVVGSSLRLTGNGSVNVRGLD